MKLAPPLLIPLLLTACGNAGQKDPELEPPPPPPDVSRGVGSLSVEVINLRNDDGTLLVDLFASPDGFPDEPAMAYRNASTNVSGGRGHVMFDELPFGTYAISNLHDEDDDGDLDANFFGIPSEGVSVSNQAERETNGIPSFTSAKFEFAVETMDVVLEMTYY